MHLTNLNAKDATRPFSQKMLISKQCSVCTVSCVGKKRKKKEEEDSKVYGHGACHPTVKFVVLPLPGFVLFLKK